MKTYAYIRVSSLDQNESRQLKAIKELQIPQRNIYLDKQSGKDFQRENYKRLLKALRKGDLLYILRSGGILGRTAKNL